MASKRPILPIISMSALVLLSACGGGGNGPTPVPTPTPTPAPVRSLITQGNRALPGPEGDFSYFFNIPVTTPIAGTLEVTVDWTHPTNEVWVYVSSGVCTVEQFQSCPGAGCPCQFLAASETSSPKPRVLSLPSVPAGSRNLFIWNLGPVEESVNYQVFLVN